MAMAKTKDRETKTTGKRGGEIKYLNKIKEKDRKTDRKIHNLWENKGMKDMGEDIWERGEERESNWDEGVQAKVVSTK